MADATAGRRAAGRGGARKGLRNPGSGQPRWLLPYVLVVLGLLVLLPLGRLGLAAVETLGRPGAGTVLTERATWIATRNTLVVAAGGMVLSVLLGGTVALLLALTDLRGRTAFAFAFMLPLMIPPQITAIAWIQMSGPSSPLLRTLGLAPPLGSPQPLYSLGGIALLLGVQNAPLVFLAYRAALGALPRNLQDAARVSGAGPGRLLVRVILPLSLPGLLAGAAMAFVSNVGNFGIPVILGIPRSIFTLPTLIYSRLVGFGTSVFGDMALLSCLVGAIAVAGILLQGQAQARARFTLRGAGGGAPRFRLGRWRLPVELALLVVLAAILVAPLAALVVSSLLPTYGVVLSAATASVEAYRQILFHQQSTLLALRNSLTLATGASLGLLLLTVPLALWLRGRRGPLAVAVEALADLPYALPGIVIGVAFVLLFAAPVPLLGVSIYGTLWIILLAYLASYLSVGLKPLVAAVAQLDPRLEEAARISGAGFATRLVRIVLPAIAPAAGAAVILVFLIAVNELTVSALLWAAGTQTLGVMVYNLSDSGSMNLAAALSVLIVGLVLLLMLGLELLAPRLPRGVVPWRG